MKTSTRIIIEAVEPGNMRLPSYREVGCGDWWVDPENGDIRIQVASTTDIWDDEETFLVALHELIEARLCAKAGIVQGAVDAFDEAFTGDGEPGDSPLSPYQHQHRQAMLLEHQMALFLGIWNYGEVR